MTTRITANGKHKLQLVGSGDAPRLRGNTFAGVASRAGSSGEVPRKPRRTTGEQHGKPRSPYGLSAYYQHNGLPVLSKVPCTYKVSDYGYTDDSMVAKAYSLCIEKRTGVTCPITTENGD